VVSFASGCLPADALTLRGTAGDERNGEEGRIDRFGSSAKDVGFDAAVVCWPSVSALSSDCGPKENEEPME
jgi:hypothetical protein